MEKLVLLVALVLVVGLSIGCGNTTSFMASGTGLFLQTPVGTIALGNIETSITDIDASEEVVTISDTTYFEGNASINPLGGETASESIAGLSKQREYAVTIEPVETGQTWEEQ